MSNLKNAILIVDDLPSIRAVVANIVRDLGFEPVEAGNGLEALERVKEMTGQGTPPRLITLDLNMPVMDGITFIKEVRRNDRKTPILMLTTETDPDKRREGKQAGANAWITKPIDLERFAALIRRFTAS